MRRRRAGPASGASRGLSTSPGSGEQPAVTYVMGANTYRLMSGFAAGETPAGTDEFTVDEQASVDD